MPREPAFRPQSTPTCGRSSSNGAKLRLLRDSARPVFGAAYVEFDLQAVFDGELFADFVLLYFESATLPGSRSLYGGGQTILLPRIGGWRPRRIPRPPGRWNQLRHGVETCVGILGTGFLNHPDNTQLRKRIPRHPTNCPSRISTARC